MSTSPLSYTNSRKYKLTLAAVSGVFVYLFLLFFQPFGINNYRPDEKVSLTLMLVLLLMALLVFLVIIFNEMFVRHRILSNSSPIQFVPWVIWEFLVVTSFTFLFYNFMGEFHDFNFKSYLKHILEMGSVLVFPFAATIFFFRHSRVVKDYEKVLSLSSEQPKLNDIIYLSGDYKKDQLALPLNKIVYIQSEDNYVGLNYLEKDQLKKYLIRSTLTKLDEKLNAPLFVRCNRAAMANIYHLESFKYESKKLIITLNHLNEKIIVSKTHHKKVLRSIEEFSKMD